MLENKVASQSLAQPVSSGLKLIREMAQWRLDNLRWDRNVNQEVQKIFLPKASSTINVTPGLKNSHP
jgi:hypothetical protein